MSYAGTAARGSAIGTATEGMLTYLNDSDSYESWNGSAWVGLGGGGGAATNAIINGAFEINQRNFSSSTDGQAYFFDRWTGSADGGTTTYTAQTFTPGTAPVAGYEARNFIRIATAGQSTQSQYSALVQKIEDVRTLSNNTVTLSFWAKAGSGTPTVWPEFQQNFGSGGSPSSTVVAQIGSGITLSTSWARYTVSFTLPSLTGKTIGTTANTSFVSMVLWTSLGSSIRAYSGATFQNVTIDVWGVQLEAGSTATPFRRNANSLQGELAACQRYYIRYTSTVSNGPVIPGLGSPVNTTIADFYLPVPVQLRVTPSAIDFSNIQVYVVSNSNVYSSGSFVTSASVTYDSKLAQIRYTHGSGVFTAGQVLTLNGSSTNNFIGLSAEL
jgi:hypothetical protein